jgi:hypothetical protein
MFKVEYIGFLQTVTRYFPTYDQAVTWARQVGRYTDCTITLIDNERI